MTTTKEISAAEWLKVREHLVTEMKLAAKQQQAPTLRNIAEHLLEAELVDIDAILKKIRPHESDDSLDAELVDRAVNDATVNIDRFAPRLGEDIDGRPGDPGYGD